MSVNIIHQMTIVRYDYGSISLFFIDHIFSHEALVWEKELAVVSDDIPSPHPLLVVLFFSKEHSVFE